MSKRFPKIPATEYRCTQCGYKWASNAEHKKCLKCGAPEDKLEKGLIIIGSNYFKKERRKRREEEKRGRYA